MKLTIKTIDLVQSLIEKKHGYEHNIQTLSEEIDNLKCSDDEYWEKQEKKQQYLVRISEINSVLDLIQLY